MQTATPLATLVHYYARDYSFKEAGRRSILDYLYEQDRLSSYRPEMEIMDLNKQVHIHVEEPELSLYPDAQCKLMDTIVKEVFEEKDNDREMGVMMATHSPYIVNYLNLLMRRNGKEDGQVSLDASKVEVYEVLDGCVVPLKTLEERPLIDTRTLSSMRRFNAPEWNTEPQIRWEDIDDHMFDVDDPKDNSQTVKRAFESGTASYVNGSAEQSFALRVICYDEYLHQFVFDDGQGHTDTSLLKDNTKMADLIVYDRDESRVWIVIHELSKGSVQNKRNRARLQLSATLNMLCKSEKVKAFIGKFSNNGTVGTSSKGVSFAIVVDVT